MSELELEGSLAEHDLPELVPILQGLKWTGLLTLHRGGATKSITLERGRMVFAGSSDPDDRLGELLLKRGLITLRQLVDAGALVDADTRLGTILVRNGVLPPQELVRGVVDQARQIILSAFEWAEGRYRLEPGQRPDEAITLNIDPPQLVLDGIRCIGSWRRIHRAVGGLPASYRARDGQAGLLERLQLSEPERQLADLLGSPHSVESLCERSPLSSFAVCQLLWALRVIGFAERLPEVGPDDDGLGAVPTDAGAEG